MIIATQIRMHRFSVLTAMTCSLLWSCGATLSKAQSGGDPSLPEAIAAASDLTDNYHVTPNIVYLKSPKYEARLDVYRRKSPGTKATLIYIHGGGWRGGPSKEEYSLWFQPFLMLGWNVINVEYRPSTVAPAPAAVEDCICALHWVALHATEYDVDVNRVILMGHSAGAHLALMTAMAPASAGFDHECPEPAPLKIAAVIDWFGIADVADLLHGPHTQTFAQQWIGTAPGAEARARSVSPLAYVRSGLPPTILIHGDKDPKVPYSQAVTLHHALEKVSVATELVTIPGGGHGGYGNAQTQNAYAHIFQFLTRNGIETKAAR